MLIAALWTSMTWSCVFDAMKKLKYFRILVYIIDGSELETSASKQRFILMFI